MEQSGGGAVTNPEDNTDSNNGIGMITWSNVDSSRLITHSNSDFFVKEGCLRTKIPSKEYEYISISPFMDYNQYYDANGLMNNGKVPEDSALNKIYQQLFDLSFREDNYRFVNALSYEDWYEHPLILINIKTIDTYLTSEACGIRKSIDYICSVYEGYYKNDKNPFIVFKNTTEEDILLKGNFCTYVSNKQFFISKSPLRSNCAVLVDKGINGYIMEIEYEGSKIAKNKNEILKFIENGYYKNERYYYFDSVIIVNIDVNYNENDFESEMFAEFNSITIDYYDREFNFLRTISSI